MEQQRAIRLRRASRIVGYGGILLCLIAAAAWYVVFMVVGKKTYAELEKVTIGGVELLPLIPLIAAGVALVCLIVAIILRICARVRPVVEEVGEPIYEDEDGESTDEQLPAEPVAAEPVEATDTRSAGRKLLAAAAAKMFSADVCKKLDAAAEKAEHRAAGLKENAGLIIPGLIACAVAGSMARKKKMEAKRLREQAEARKQIYRWLG